MAETLVVFNSNYNEVDEEKGYVPTPPVNAGYVQHTFGFNNFMIFFPDETQHRGDTEFRPSPCTWAAAGWAPPPAPPGTTCSVLYAQRPGIYTVNCTIIWHNDIPDAAIAAARAAAKKLARAPSSASKFPVLPASGDTPMLLRSGITMSEVLVNISGCSGSGACGDPVIWTILSNKDFPAETLATDNTLTDTYKEHTGTQVHHLATHHITGKFILPRSREGVPQTKLGLSLYANADMRFSPQSASLYQYPMPSMLSFSLEYEPLGRPFFPISTSSPSFSAAPASAHAHGHGHGHASGHGHEHGHAHGNEHGHAHSNGHGNEHGHGHSNGHGNEHGHAHSNGHGNEHGHGHANGHGNEHGHGHTNGHNGHGYY